MDAIQKNLLAHVPRGINIRKIMCSCIQGILCGLETGHSCEKTTH